MVLLWDSFKVTQLIYNRIKLHTPYCLNSTVMCYFFWFKLYLNCFSWRKNRTEVITWKVTGEIKRRGLLGEVKLKLSSSVGKKGLLGWFRIRYKKHKTLLFQAPNCVDIALEKSRDEMKLAVAWRRRGRWQQEQVYGSPKEKTFTQPLKQHFHVIVIHTNNRKQWPHKMLCGREGGGINNLLEIMSKGIFTAI